jgi:cysteine desulfurase
LVERLTSRGRGIVIHGLEAPRLEHVVNFRAPGWKGDELVAALDLAGVCVSSGSACSAGTAEPSPVIEAMLGREAARGAVRVSFGEDSTEEDLDALCGVLIQLGILAPGGVPPAPLK